VSRATGPEKMSLSTPQASFRGFFSEGHTRSPVSPMVDLSFCPFCWASTAQCPTPPSLPPEVPAVCGKGAIHHREFAMASGEMSES
jgi:hypothetical protein